MELTFGEQMKIILGRKGMSIKELAELMEQQTGKPMSRQNLTQRLNRDNFQEQDMRILAGILGYQVKIQLEPLQENGVPEIPVMPKTMVKKVREQKKEPQTRESGIIKEIPAFLRKQEPVLGDIDPRTGKEYETNTVRVHDRIQGYIQVYDGSEHRWVDVEERNFMEFQESKRQALGRDYRPPIYLDYT